MNSERWYFHFSYLHYKTSTFDFEEHAMSEGYYGHPQVSSEQVIRLIVLNPDYNKDETHDLIMFCYEYGFREELKKNAALAMWLLVDPNLLENAVDDYWHQYDKLHPDVD